jgi:hypothetical protein
MNAAPIDSLELARMRRALEYEEPYARNDPAFVALKADLKNGRFRTMDHWTDFREALMAIRFGRQFHHSEADHLEKLSRDPWAVVLEARMNSRDDE